LQCLFDLPADLLFCCGHLFLLIEVVDAGGGAGKTRVTTAMAYIVL
jgi:hypothetical protein